MALELVPEPTAAAGAVAASVVVLLGPGEVYREMHGRPSSDRVLSARALSWATDRARSLGVPLRLVTVTEVPAGERFGDHASESYPTWWAVRTVLDRMIDRVGAASGDVDVEAELRAGPWSAVLAEEAAAAALVLITTGGDDPLPAARVPDRCRVVVLAPEYEELSATWLGARVAARGVVEPGTEVPR